MRPVMLTRECRAIRKKIHEWMDESAPASMPDAVAEHIRHCSDCHLFVKQWNAVEVGIVSMRGSAPALSASFAPALDARINAASQDSPLVSWFRRLVPPRQAKLALMGGSAALIAALCYFLGAAMVSGLNSRSATSIVSSNHSQPAEPAPPIPAQIQLAPR